MGAALEEKWREEKWRGKVRPLDATGGGGGDAQMAAARLEGEGRRISRHFGAEKVSWEVNINMSPFRRLWDSVRCTYSCSSLHVLKAALASERKRRRLGCLPWFDDAVTALLAALGHSPNFKICLHAAAALSASSEATLARLSLTTWNLNPSL